MDNAPISTNKFTTYRELLAVKPERWGYRGDPRLWDVLYEVLGDRIVPSSYSDLSKEILDEIFTFSGFDLTQEKEFVRVPQLMRGSGMSDGMVSTSWWLDECLPLLWQRVQG